MILNNAKNIYMGNTQIEKIIFNSKQIWTIDSNSQNLFTSNILPFIFSANGKMIKKYQFKNSNINNSIGVKTLNLAPPINNWFMDIGLGAEGGIVDPYPGWMVSDYIEIEPSSNYCFSCTSAILTSPSNKWHRIVFFDENKLTISYSDIDWFNTVFTTPENAKYIRIFCTTWERPMLYKAGQQDTYVPSGYDIPIILNNTTYHMYTSSPNWKKIVVNDFNNISSIAWQNGPINFKDGSTIQNFYAQGPENNHYTFYGKVNNSLHAECQKYIYGTWSSTNRALSAGTYTVSLTIYNFPTTDTWRIGFIHSSGTSYHTKGCNCTSSNISNGIATSYETFTVDETDQTQFSWALLEFAALGEKPEWYHNVIVDVRIVEGAKPVFPTRVLITNNNETIPIAIAPKLITANGTNTIDIDTSLKPTEISLLLEQSI